MANGAQLKVVVIGAGIVGISTALHLQRDGHEVTVLDRQPPGEATSFGNAGIVACSSVVPVTVPGLLAKVPGLLLDPDSPLYLRWGYLPKLMPWLVPYLRCATASKTAEIAQRLAPMVSDSVEQHRQLAEGTGAAKWLVDSEILYAYANRQAYEADAFAWGLRRECGFSWEVLDRKRLLDVEPMLGPKVQCGVLLRDHGAVRYPSYYVKDLAAHFVSQGGAIVTGEARDVVIADGRVCAVITAEDRLDCDAAVIAGGAWSAQLTEKLGLKTPLETERGYHIELLKPSVTPRCPIALASGKFFASPMAEGLRVAGLVEFGGLDAPASARPFVMLKRRVKELFPKLDYEEAREWMGHRPAPIDSLPFLGEAPGRRGLYCAFGHHHVGLTSGPKTGRLIADLVAGRKPNLDLTPYRVDRFA